MVYFIANANTTTNDLSVIHDRFTGIDFEIIDTLNNRPVLKENDFVIFLNWAIYNDRASLDPYQHSFYSKYLTSRMFILSNIQNNFIERIKRLSCYGDVYPDLSSRETICSFKELFLSSEDNGDIFYL